LDGGFSCAQSRRLACRFFRTGSCCTDIGIGFGLGFWSDVCFGYCAGSRAGVWTPTAG
jgi:hypothetical protein